MMLLVLQFSLCSLAVTSAYVIQDQGYQWQDDSNRPEYQQGYQYQVPYQYINLQLPTSASPYSGVTIVPHNEDTYSVGAEEKFSEWNKVRLKGNKSRFKQQFRKRRRSCRHRGHRPHRHRRPHRRDNPFIPDNLRGYRRSHATGPGERVTYLKRNPAQEQRNNMDYSRRYGNRNQIKRVLNQFATRRWNTGSDEDKHTDEEGYNQTPSADYDVDKIKLETNNQPSKPRMERYGNRNKIKRVLNQFATRRWNIGSDEDKNMEEKGDNQTPSADYDIDKIKLETNNQPSKPRIRYNLNSQGPNNRPLSILQKNRNFLNADGLRSKLLARPYTQISHHTTERNSINNSISNKQNRLENSAIELRVIPQTLTPPNIVRYPKYTNMLTEDLINKEHKPCDQKEQHETSTTKYTLLQIAKGTVNVLDHPVRSSTEEPTRDISFIRRSNHINYLTFDTTSKSPVNDEFYPIVGYTIPTPPLGFNSIKIHASENISSWSEKETVITVTPVASLTLGYLNESDNVINSQVSQITSHNNSRTVKSLNLHQPRKIQSHRYTPRNPQQLPNINGTRWKPMGLKTASRANEEVIVGKVHPLIRVGAPPIDNSVNQNFVRINLVDAKPVPLEYLPKKHMKRENKPVISGQVEPVVQRRTWIDKNSDDLTAVVSSHIIVQ